MTSPQERAQVEARLAALAAQVGKHRPSAREETVPSRYEAAIRLAALNAQVSLAMLRRGAA